MSANSLIEWTDATWPIVQGCDPVSQGCVHCYAVPLLWRMMHNPNPKISGPLQGVVEKHVNAAGETILRFTGVIAERRDRLTWPFQWKKPLKIFVPSHGDLFHRRVARKFIDMVFAVMAQTPHHTYQVLTKRSKRMRDYCSDPEVKRRIGEAIVSNCWPGDVRSDDAIDWEDPAEPAELKAWPLPNVWLGVSAEDQRCAEERVPHLILTPAVKRFISAEPLLGPLDLSRCGAHYTKSGPLHLWKTDLPGNDGWRPQHGNPAPEIATARLEAAFQLGEAAEGTIFPAATVERVMASRPFPPCFTVRTDDFGNYAPGRWAWLLSDVQPLVPRRPVIGHQGFFDLPAGWNDD